MNLTINRYPLVLALLFHAIIWTGRADAIEIDGDTPWVVMTADFENPAIQEAIRDAERDWYKVFGYPPVIFQR